MDKKFRVYLKGIDNPLIITATRYEIAGEWVKFFNAEGETDPELYVATDAVAAIQPFTPQEANLPSSHSYSGVPTR